MKVGNDHPFKDFILGSLKKAGYKNPKIVGDRVIVDENLRDDSNWPLLWKVIDEIGFSWGCGGTYYHQISTYPNEKSSMFPASEVLFSFTGSKPPGTVGE